MNQTRSERLALVLLVLLVAPLLWFGLKPSGVRLADGRRLRVLATTVGPIHEFSTGGHYQRPPWVWLPAKVHARFDWQSLSVSTRVVDDSSLVVWFTGFDPATGSQRPPTCTRIELVDGAGTKLAQAGQAHVPLADRSLGLALFPGLTNLPAGSRLRFFTGPAPGEFVEVNPPALRR